MAFGSRPRGVLHAARDVSMPRGGDLVCMPRNKEGGFDIKQVVKANRFLASVRRVLSDSTIQSPEQLRRIVGIAFEAFDDDSVWVVAEDQEKMKTDPGFKDQMDAAAMLSAEQISRGEGLVEWGTAAAAGPAQVHYQHLKTAGAISRGEAPTPWDTAAASSALRSKAVDGVAMVPQQTNRPLAALIATFPPFHFGPEKREHPEGEVQQGSGPRPRTH